MSPLARFVLVGIGVLCLVGAYRGKFDGDRITLAVCGLFFVLVPLVDLVLWL
jgi:hypothetical protein